VNSSRIMACHSGARAAAAGIVLKIVSLALAHQESTSRTESSTIASGNAAEISGQSEPWGQSTPAR
jgi:hypothetical protein